MNDAGRSPRDPTADRIVGVVRDVIVDVIGSSLVGLYVYGSVAVDSPLAPLVATTVHPRRSSGAAPTGNDGRRSMRSWRTFDASPVPPRSQDADLYHVRRE